MGYKTGYAADSHTTLNAVNLDLDSRQLLDFIFEWIDDD